MNIRVPACIAVNTELMTEVDFSTDQWNKFQIEMIPEGIDLQDLLPETLSLTTIDAEQCLYEILIDGRCIRNMWVRCEEKLDYVTWSGQWIPDTTIPPHDWMSPCRGEDSYWWWGRNSPYVIGITLRDLEATTP